jgi:hypothetical protein
LLLTFRKQHQTTTNNNETKNINIKQTTTNKQYQTATKTTNINIQQTATNNNKQQKTSNK